MPCTFPARFNSARPFEALCKMISGFEQRVLGAGNDTCRTRHLQHPGAFIINHKIDMLVISPSTAISRRLTCIGTAGRSAGHRSASLVVRPELNRIWTNMAILSRERCPTSFRALSLGYLFIIPVRYLFCKRVTQVDNPFNKE